MLLLLRADFLNTKLNGITVDLPVAGHVAQVSQRLLVQYQYAQPQVGNGACTFFLIQRCKLQEYLLLDVWNIRIHLQLLIIV